MAIVAGAAAGYCQRMRRPSPRFEAWVAPALARPQLWRLAAGTMVAVACWVAAATALTLVALALDAGPRGEMLAFLFGFAGLTLGLALALPWLHRRRLASLIGPPGFRPKPFLAGVAVVAVAAALTTGPALWIAGAERNLPLATWLGWAPVALAAVLVQTSAEELMFRGYLPQQLAARARSPLLWMGLPALAFGALHWNPELGPNAWAAATLAGVTGLVYADVTAREGDLSPAIGLHFANNAIALMVAGPPGPLGAFALWRAPVDPGDAEAMRAALAGSLALTLAAWGLYRLTRGRRLQSRRPGSI